MIRSVMLPEDRERKITSVIVEATIMWRTRKNFKKDRLAREELKRLLKKSIKTNVRMKSIAKRLEIELLNSNIDTPQLTKKTLVILSTWCHTGGPLQSDERPNAEEQARKISKLLYGKVVPRMDGDRYHK